MGSVLSDAAGGLSGRREGPVAAYILGLGSVEDSGPGPVAVYILGSTPLRTVEIITKVN